jgi:plasmid maintenance system antidote protein VapI
VERILKDIEVTEIINLLKTTDMTLKDIAKHYNVHVSVIRALNSGRVYADITKLKPSQRIRKQIRLLNEKQVLEIVKLLREDMDMKIKDIAFEYGVHPITVTEINNGNRYTDITGLNRGEKIRDNYKYRFSDRFSDGYKLTKQEVLEIVELLKECKISMDAIAKMYDVRTSSISKINTGRSYRSLTDIYIKGTLRKGVIREKYARSDYTHVYKKLLNHEVEEIIFFLRNTNLTHIDIALMYNLSVSSITGINMGKIYTNTTNLQKGECIRKRSYRAKISISKSAKEYMIKHDILKEWFTDRIKYFDKGAETSIYLVDGVIKIETNGA